MRAKDPLFGLVLLAVVGAIAVGSTAAAAVGGAGEGSSGCPGDCDGNGTVTVAEVLRALNIALGRRPLSDCVAADLNGDGRIVVSEILAAVNALLFGCPSPGLVMAPTPRVLEANIHSIGVEWDIVDGDEDHLAKGRVCYRKRGQTSWKKASLYRVDYHGYYESSEAYRRFNMFAGSLMFLEPATQYELQLKMGTPPAECGRGRIFSVATRPIPQRATARRTLHVKGDDTTAHGCGFVSPADVAGGQPSSCDCAANPTRAGCAATICDGRSADRAFIGFRQADACARPGDRMLVHDGTYRAHRFVRSGTAGQYISWVGAAWDIAQTRATVRLDPLALDSPGVTLKALLLEADHLWFEGLDLAPIDGLEATNGRLVGILGGLRAPSNCDTFEQCKATCQADPQAHCDDYGTTDIVITHNTIRNFSTGIASGVWCDTFGGQFVPSYWTRGHRSRRWADGPCQDSLDDQGEIWGGDPTGMADDRHRDDMHRRWYVADNVVTNNFPDGNPVFLTFMADSDIAYNHLSRTQHRSDWGTLKDKLLPANCTLGDQSGVSLWPTQADCGEDGKGICGTQGMSWECPAELHGQESGAPCYCPVRTPEGHIARPEPDVMFLASTSNVDVYGNEGRDAQDNFIQGDLSYANLRIWRNRAVDPGNAMITLAPMQSAPWYVVRNELISYSGPAFMPRVFDRTVIINNTFVVRHGTTALRESQLMMSSVARNNLWILGFTPDPGRDRPHGELWSGQGDGFAGTHQLQPGTSHSNYRTDVDYDGFDWDQLPDNNPNGVWEVHWSSKCNAAAGQTSCCITNCSDCTQSCFVSGTILWQDIRSDVAMTRHLELQPISGSNEASFQRMTRGCAGGPRDGKYCEKDADCVSQTDVVYDRDVNQPFVPHDPNAVIRCAFLEEHFTHVNKETVLSLCAAQPPDQCVNLLDDYAATEASGERLTATGAAIDAGDPDFYASEQYLLNDIGPDGMTIVPFGSGIPDLGAYEAGQPKVHYGPRP